ncbi:5656_t:CDS:2 [Acaulospora colombiana]|uniref:5656_t:CDS:1 n=1 Tax=Acaulospora colombiana TaxID=27376 RepID=A0ACA9JYD6_9GLOM|nr:5656_t:CDS:2 [Acaulospora colombiana]
MTTQSFKKSNYKVRFPPVEGIEELGISGKGIIVNDDIKSWKFNRSIFLQTLTIPKFLRQVVELTKLHFQEMEKYWEFFDRGQDGGEEIQLVEWIHRLNTDFIFHITTGKRYYALASYHSSLLSSAKIVSEKSPEDQPHLSDITPEIIKESEILLSCINSYLISLNFFGLYPRFLRATLQRKRRDELLKKKEWLFGKLTEIVRERRKEIDEIPADEELNYDMLTTMITANTERDVYVIKKNMEKKLEGDERPLSDEEIVVNMTEAFVVRKRLLEELDTVFNAKTSDSSLTNEDISKLVYCEAIIKETARFDPVVPFFDRQSTDTDVVADYSWGPKTQFSVSIGRIHKKPKYWENPDQFNPDRFLQQNMKVEDKNTFLQFGTGLRYCPGHKVAMTEIKCLIALLYRKYDIELVDMNAPLDTSYNTIQRCSSLKIRVRRRNV